MHKENGNSESPREGDVKRDLYDAGGGSERAAAGCDVLCGGARAAAAGGRGQRRAVGRAARRARGRRAAAQAAAPAPVALRSRRSRRSHALLT